MGYCFLSWTEEEQDTFAQWSTIALGVRAADIKWGLLKQAIFLNTLKNGCN